MEISSMFYRDELRRLAAEAEQQAQAFENAGDRPSARAQWKKAVTALLRLAKRVDPETQGEILNRVRHIRARVRRLAARPVKIERTEDDDWDPTCLLVPPERLADLPLLGLDRILEDILGAISLSVVNDPRWKEPDDTHLFLLVGPPGVGKTSAVRWLARKLGWALLEGRLDRILSPYYGVSTRRLGKLFDLARKLSPSLVFLDEIDKLAGGQAWRSSEDDKQINLLRTQLEGLVRDPGRPVFVFLAANDPGVIDGGILSRACDTYEFPLPDQRTIRLMLASWLGGYDLEFNLAEAARRLDGQSGRDVKGFAKRLRRHVIRRANPGLYSTNGQRPPDLGRYELRYAPMSPSDVETVLKDHLKSLAVRQNHYLRRQP
jgi:SpoVK/Ycf46/Vps4 family AAA+-type ATPase